MNIDALNASTFLRKLPIGELRVIMFCDQPAVELRDHRHIKGKPGRIIHMLGPDENPLNAVYGKRFWEQGAMRAAYEAEKDEATAAIKREDDDTRALFKKEVSQIIRRRGDDARDILRGGLRCP